MKEKEVTKVFVAKTTDSTFHKHVKAWAISNDTTIQKVISEFLAHKTGYNGCSKLNAANNV